MIVDVLTETENLVAVAYLDKYLHEADKNPPIFLILHSPSPPPWQNNLIDQTLKKSRAMSKMIEDEEIQNQKMSTCKKTHNILDQC